MYFRYPKNASIIGKPFSETESCINFALESLTKKILCSKMFGGNKQEKSVLQCDTGDSSEGISEDQISQ